MSLPSAPHHLPWQTNCGTPQYMAPEVHLMGDSAGSRKIQHYGKEADLWGLGVILHVMLTCIMPFGNDDSQQMVDDIKAKANSPSTSSQPDWCLMQGEAWETVSDVAKSLINGLLCADMKKRYTIDMCRKHPWMRVTSSPTHGLSPLNPSPKKQRRMVEDRKPD